MASWSRSRQPAAIAGVRAEHVAARLADLAGDQVCTQPGCLRATGIACDYVDRRGHHCRTAWCPEHRLVIDGRVYCRRHAGVVSALPVGYVGHTAPMPDLETRAPSLVSWVAREIDADIRHLLLEADRDGHAQLITDPVYLVFVGRDRRRAWERAWKLIGHAGESLRVSLLVEEAADAEVAIRVDSAIVERLAPPWIVQRLHGALPPPEVDARRRKDFNRRILSIISKGMEREGRGSPGARVVRGAPEAALQPR